ncbi:SUZ domain-containing protein 1 [Bulinus truncatus]|nr:SUZ domain-containing protein 1 [Bulinus truncatus]
MRVKKLFPKSPRKRAAVIGKLVSDFEVHGEPLSERARGDGLDDAAKALVKAFYVRDDISRIAPSKRDVVTLKTSEGKPKVRKRHMCFSQKEAHNLFLETSAFFVDYGEKYTCFSDYEETYTYSSDYEEKYTCFSDYEEMYTYSSDYEEKYTYSSDYEEKYTCFSDYEEMHTYSSDYEEKCNVVFRPEKRVDFSVTEDWYSRCLGVHNMAEEEIYLDSWEEQADSGMLDKRLEEMSIDIQAKEMERKKQTQSSVPTAVLVDECGKTQYQPQVRILRREPKTSSSPPKNVKNNTGSINTTGSSKHSKSLQQREAEYAQARLRIFGSLPPDDDSVINNVDNFSPQEDITIEKQCSPQIIKVDPSSPRVSIIRQPRGPDGTSGFKKADLT